MTRQGLRQSLYTTQEERQDSTLPPRREGKAVTKRDGQGAPTRKKKGNEKGGIIDRVAEISAKQGGDTHHKVDDHPLLIHGSAWIPEMGGCVSQIFLVHTHP